MLYKLDYFFVLIKSGVYGGATMNKIGAKVDISKARNANVYFRFLCKQAQVDRMIDRRAKQDVPFQVMNHLATTNTVGRVWSFA